MSFLRILIAIILPPLGVFMRFGLGSRFWLNVLLTILGYVPGLVHAVYVLAANEPESAHADRINAHYSAG